MATLPDKSVHLDVFICVVPIARRIGWPILLGAVGGLQINKVIGVIKKIIIEIKYDGFTALLFTQYHQFSCINTPPVQHILTK